MLIKEQISDHDDDTLVIRRTHDVTHALTMVEALKHADAPMSDSVAVGVVPAALLDNWLQEAGVSWDDPASEDVIRRKLLSGEFNRLRPWTGNF